MVEQLQARRKLRLVRRLRLRLCLVPPLRITLRLGVRVAQSAARAAPGLLPCHLRPCAAALRSAPHAALAAHEARVLVLEVVPLQMHDVHV